MLQRTPILPPDPIPTTEPSLTDGLRPVPDMPKSEGWKEKVLIKSRTIATIVVTVLLFVAGKFFGVDIDASAIGVSADGGITILEALLLAGSFLAGFFRIKATGPIAGVITPPTGG
jgi:hypothetical protein